MRTLASILSGTLSLMLLSPGFATGQVRSFAVVNTSQLIAESMAGQDAASRLESYDADRSRALIALREEYTRMSQSYQAQARALEPSVRTERERALSDLERRIAREQEDYETDMQNHYEDFMQPVASLASQVLDEYRESQGYWMIIDPSAVEGLLLSIDPSLDVTADIIEGMNDAWIGTSEEPDPQQQ